MASEDDPGGASPRTGLRIRPQRFWLIIGAVLAGALGTIASSAIMAPERQDDVWVELANPNERLLPGETVTLSFLPK